ncbi:MAG: ABC transporter ATP-binding protein, partial [Gemmatimonadota bacterium]
TSSYRQPSSGKRSSSSIEIPVVTVSAIAAPSSVDRREATSTPVELHDACRFVGESGSGKTTLGRAVVGLIEPTAGEIRFDGVDLVHARGRPLRALRRRIQIVFQDPYASLSPRMPIGRFVAEPLVLHRIVPRAKAREKAAELLAQVGLEPYFLDRFPHEMSGGQRQRIAIARALAPGPDLLVADEPVSALDVSVQAQVLGILLELQRSRGIAMLFVSHDLRVVERVADRIAVMYRGRIVEIGSAASVASSPLHPYTQALLSAVPEPDPGRRHRIRLTGEPPSPTEAPVGCPFAGRCPEVRPVCRETHPPLESKRTGHLAACHFR